MHRNIEIYILPSGIVQLNTIYIKVYLLTASQDVTMKPKSKIDSKLANLETEARPRHLGFETDVRPDISKV